VTITTPAHRELAHWLLTHEVNNGQEPVALADAAETICRKLTPRLARLVTFAGCQAILARALHLATTDFPFLNGVRPGLSPEICFDGLGERVQGMELAQAREGLAMLLASVLGLLATFIGDELTLRLVRDVWPDAHPGDTDAAAHEEQT
jgi:hypothetical protein